MLNYVLFGLILSLKYYENIYILLKQYYYITHRKVKKMMIIDEIENLKKTEKSSKIIKLDRGVAQR